MSNTDVIKQAVKLYPNVAPFLTGRARWIVYGVGGLRANVDNSIKTYDYFLTTLERLVRSVYTGLLRTEFIDIAANLIQGQLIQAYEQAWIDEGNILPMPDFLQQAAENAILNQFEYVDQYYKDILNAGLLGLDVMPLIERAKLWAQRFKQAYNDAILTITANMGGKLKWELGATEEHCETCMKLNGVVDYASEWQKRDIKPQNAPNGKLDCGGWKCDCSLTSTTERRTKGGLAGKGF